MNNRAGVIVAAVVCLLVLGAGIVWEHFRRINSEADRLILLVPDGARFSDPRITVWLDAASEEGLHVVPMHDSSFIRPLFPKPRCAGVILPDSIHVRASDLLVSAVREYVAAGGHLMLVYDAATQYLNGFYPRDRSRLSDLAGTDYSLYQSLGGNMIRSSDVSGTIPVMDELGVPPGKYYPFLPPKPKKSDAAGNRDAQTQLRRYEYGNLEYGSFVTSGHYSGQVLLRSAAGVAAGRHAFGKGSALFVNLPLGYLAGQTDGVLLHSFLNYFAVQELSLPYLLAAPDGVGGLVLDWHVDSNAAIQALQTLNTWTILRQGPYSIDITAGPDTYAVGDGKGFDLLHNPVSGALVRKYVGLGYEIGSHGGWIHNYFAAHIETDDPQKMAVLLQLNSAAVEQVTGKPVVEYSAPNGDQPEWVTRWLESHGFVAYYFTGDTGLGPTQVYREGRRVAENIWAFPFVQMDRAASFEEMRIEKISPDAVQQWLEAVTNFTATHQQVRLVYFHPPGILSFRKEVDNWLEKTAQLKAQGRFRWYTMVQMATFMNARKKVQWTLTERDGLATLKAADPQTLAHETWKFPADKFAEPRVAHGSATILHDSNDWLVVAGEGNQLSVESRISGR